MAQQFAARADQGRAAPQWMVRRREDRVLLQEALPVARKLLPRDDPRCYRARPPTIPATTPCSPIGARLESPMGSTEMSSPASP